MRRSTWVAIGIAVLLVVGVGFAAANGGDRSGQVKVACHAWVKERIAPVPADFSDESMKREGETYVVTGLVNGERYQCEATHDGNASHLVNIGGLD